MTLRRLSAAIPLAVLVAVLAHLAGFGAGHAPGGDRATQLLGSLGAALGLSLLASFLAGAPRPRQLRIATTLHDCKTVLAVAGFAVVSFAGIELAEGHAFAMGGVPGAALALLPLATFVAFAARCVGHAASRAGERLARYARRRAPGIARAFVLAATWKAPVGRPAGDRGTNRGRAPPLPA